MGFQLLFSLIEMVVAFVAVNETTLSGKLPGVYGSQLDLLALIRLGKKTTSRAVSGAPFDHLYGLSVMVSAVSSLFQTGRLASDRLWSIDSEPLSPSQYSGLSIRFWKLQAFWTVSQVSGPSGKMQFGAEAGCSAHVIPWTLAELFAGEPELPDDPEEPPLDPEQAARMTARAVAISAGPASRAFLMRGVLLLIFATTCPPLVRNVTVSSCVNVTTDDDTTYADLPADKCDDTNFRLPSELQYK